MAFGFFKSGMGKPRGFSHQYIYVNERKEKLDKMEDAAKREMGILPEKEVKPEDIRGKFVEGTTHLKRRKESGRKPVHLGIFILLLLALCYIWYVLSTGRWTL